LKSPLGNVIASTFWGGEDFIGRIRKEYLKEREIDRRNIPSVRKVLLGPTPGEIESAVGQVIGEDQSLYRKLCIHFSHQWSGWSLEEIGAHFGMRDSAVSQSSRRFRKVLIVDPFALTPNQRNETDEINEKNRTDQIDETDQIGSSKG
jgi:putative transposase